VLLASDRYDPDRREHRRFLGFAMLVCLTSGVTGFLELPGYQGRALYLLVLLLIPGGAYLVFGMLNLAAERTFGGTATGRRRIWVRGLPVLIHVGALLSMLPTLISPPEAGVNVKTRGAWLRRLPEDNLLTAFIMRQQQQRADSHLLVIRGKYDQSDCVDVRDGGGPRTLTLPLMGSDSRLKVTHGSPQAIETLARIAHDAEWYVLTEPQMAGVAGDAIRQVENVDWHVIWETPRLLLAKLTTVDTQGTNLLESGYSP
jgi:hypothetical protein